MKFFNEAVFRSMRERMQKSPGGFHFCFSQNVFTEDAYRKLQTAYPPVDVFKPLVDDYKNVYEGPYYDSKEHNGRLTNFKNIDLIWHDLAREASSEEFISLFSSSIGIPFNSLRNFSFKYGREGNFIRPHLDRASTGHAYASKIVCMFYFAKTPGLGSGGTAIYDTDRETILGEAKDLFNSMLFFEQHPHAWHGYRPLPTGAERFALAMTFNLEKEPIPITTSFLLKLLHALFKNNPKIIRGILYPTTTYTFRKTQKWIRNPKLFLKKIRWLIRDTWGEYTFRWIQRSSTDKNIQHKAYQSYAAYLAHQKKKLPTLDLSEFDIQYRNRLRQRLHEYDKEIVQPGKTVLCLAARIGTEVKAFLDCGCFAVGIDLNPGPENKYVLYGDFHSIQFPGQSVDIIFTNSLDHVLDFDVFISEIRRVVRPGGHIIMEIVHGTDEGNDAPAFGYYEATKWKRIDDVVNLFLKSGFSIVGRKNIRYPWSHGGQHISFKV